MKTGFQPKHSHSAFVQVQLSKHVRKFWDSEHVSQNFYDKFKPKLISWTINLNSWHFQNFAKIFHSLLENILLIARNQSVSSFFVSTKVNSKIVKEYQKIPQLFNRSSSPVSSELWSEFSLRQISRNETIQFNSNSSRTSGHSATATISGLSFIHYAFETSVSDMYRDTSGDFFKCFLFIQS